MTTNLRILILDERPDNALLLSEYLRKQNHRVVISNDGQEALEAILRHHRTNDPYRLVIASLVMTRGIDGLSVLRQLRQHQVSVPFALYASPSAVTPSITQIARQLQCRAMLEKPIALQAVEQLLDSISETSTGTGIGTHSIAAERPRDQPFFGTSRIMRVDPPAAAAQPPVASRAPEPTSPALERIVRPAPTAPVVTPTVIPHPTPLPPPVMAPLPPVNPLSPRTPSPAPQPALPEAIAPELLSDDIPPVARPTGSYRQPPVAPTAPERPPVAPPVGGILGSAPPTRTGTERTVRPISEGYTRRSSGLFTVPNDPGIIPPTTIPTTTTARIRRSVGGAQVENAGTVLGRIPTRLVACARCGKTFTVPLKSTVYVIPCTHCGQANRIDP